MDPDLPKYSLRIKDIHGRMKEKPRAFIHSGARASGHGKLVILYIGKLENGMNPILPHTIKGEWL